jgi:hypothetical protein
LDAETLALGRAEPVRLRCVSPFALRGQGLFRVPGRLRLSPALAEVAVLRVALLSHDGRELVSTEGPPPPGSGFVACLDPAALRDETHRLRVTLRAGPGMPTFSDQVDFGVLPSY